MCSISFSFEWKRNTFLYKIFVLRDENIGTRINFLDLIYCVLFEITKIYYALSEVNHANIVWHCSVNMIHNIFICIGLWYLIQWYKVTVKLLNDNKLWYVNNDDILIHFFCLFFCLTLGTSEPCWRAVYCEKPRRKPKCIKKYPSIWCAHHVTTLVFIFST